MASIARGSAGRRVSVVRYLGRGSIRFVIRCIRQWARSAADTSRNANRDSGILAAIARASTTEPVIGIFNINCRTSLGTRTRRPRRQLFHRETGLEFISYSAGNISKTTRCSVKSFGVARVETSGRHLRDRTLAGEIMSGPILSLNTSNVIAYFQKILFSR